MIVCAVHLCTALLLAALKLPTTCVLTLKNQQRPNLAACLHSLVSWITSPAFVKCHHSLTCMYIFTSICCILLPFPGVLDSPKTLSPISITLEDTCRTPTPLLPPEGEEAPPIAVHGIGILKQLLDALSQDKDSGQTERQRFVCTS